VPPETLTAAQANDASSNNYFTEDTALFIDLDVDIELTMFVYSVDSEKRLSATKASEVMLAALARHYGVPNFALR
jgi:hypothetical protein